MKLNKKTTALGGLAALAVVGGTWAYFNQTTTIDNQLKTQGTYGSTTYEKFNPGDEWAPGAVVDKKIETKNTGNYPVLVRVFMEEDWTREGHSILRGPITSLDESFISGEQVDPEDGLTYFGNDTDASVVGKNLNETNWIKGSDGYWYYGDKLEAGQTTTPALLSSITLKEDTDMGKIGYDYEYVVVDKNVARPDDSDSSWRPLPGVIGSTPEERAESAKKELAKIAGEPENKGKDIYMKVTSGVGENEKGYSEAEYTLTIKTDVIQATPEAVEKEWGENVPEGITNLLQQSAETEETE